MYWSKEVGYHVSPSNAMLLTEDVAMKWLSVPEIRHAWFMSERDELKIEAEVLKEWESAYQFNRAKNEHAKLKAKWIEDVKAGRAYDSPFVRRIFGIPRGEKSQRVLRGQIGPQSGSGISQGR